MKKFSKDFMVKVKKGIDEEDEFAV